MVTTTTSTHRRGALAERLRRETADLHHAVEAAVDLPASVRDRVDYVRLLTALHGFHLAVETHLAAPVWQPRWAEVGIDLPSHRRSALLRRDLEVLGAGGDARAAAGPTSAWLVPAITAHLTPFPAALGCLYVMEGSALGGRVLGPMIGTALGGAPTGFFDSDGRGHPSPWRAVQGALARFDPAGPEADDVVRGATWTFVAFGRYVAGDRPAAPGAP